jgi:2-oxoglutarate ferredoxin oxidoreductase subunit alpha
LKSDGMRAKYLQRLSGKRAFILGDEACAWGAIFAGCDFFGNYPITPASEVGEVLANELANVGGYCLQMEDELGALAAVIGAVWGGARGMTATSGPGFSLMMEHIGYAVMTETPVVVDHEMIALSPSSVQECFNLTIDAFNLAEKHRHPVVVLMDGEVGHIREPLIFPDYSKVHHEPRRKAADGETPFGGNLNPGMIEIGDKRDVHITGSTHKPTGMRDVESRNVHEQLVSRFYSKIDKARREFDRYETRFLDDCDFAVVSFGCTARPTLGAVLVAREMGIKAGYIRLINIWPFADKLFRELPSNIKYLLVAEMNLGQLSREIERYVNIPVLRVGKIGGIVHSVDEILSRIKDPDLAKCEPLLLM